MPPHSVNLLSDLWPIGIDVHHYFPGFLADPSEVFETLWDRHEDVPLARVPVPACDPVSQVAVMALHYLRVSPDGRQRTPKGPLAPRPAGAVHDRCGRTRAAWPTRPTRPTPCDRSSARWESQIGNSDQCRTPKALDTWNRRVNQVGYEAWFLRFAQTPKRHWPRTFWHALMLTDEEIYAYSHVPPGEGNLTTLRLRRIRRGIAGVPRTVQAMARAKRR